MTHALSDILADRFDAEPPEISIIKDYVQSHFDQAVAVAVRDQKLVISTPSSALAGALRPHLYKLQKLCKTDKKIIVRIGH
jgi:hypothetical protein